MNKEQTNLLQVLVENLKELPGIGTKTATRLAYFILRKGEGYASNLAQSIVEARSKLGFCKECCDFTSNELCSICSNPNRNNDVICVVEEPSDIIAFEKSHYFNGKYHVLHGSLSPLDGIDETKLKIKELIDRIKRSSVKEVILATNPTVEGDTTALYIARLIKYNDIKVSRIAHGIPVGAEIEYLDGATLGKALENRVIM